MEADIQFFDTIGEKNAFIDFQRGEAEIPINILKGTVLEGTMRVYSGLLPPVIDLFQQIVAHLSNLDS